MNVLWLLPAAVLLLAGSCWVLRRASHRRALALVGERRAERWRNSTQLRRTLRALCFALACACVLLAALRKTGEGAALEPGTDVVICLDVSRSMLAGDVSPSRLEHARALVREWVLAAPGARFALVVFAGEARLLSPLTADPAAFIELLGRAEPQSVARGGTDLGAALARAADAFVPGSPTTRRVLLITDGEDHARRGLQAATRLHTQGVRVDVLPVGTARGSKIALGEGEALFVTDRSGAEVITRVDDAGLQALATAGGGALVAAKLGEQAPALPTPRPEPSSRGAQLWVLLALLLLCLGPLRASRATVWLCLLALVPALCACGGPAQQGVTAYAQGDLKGASAYFERALQEAPADEHAPLLLNAALSALEASDSERALALLTREVQTTDPALSAALLTVRGCAAMATSKEHARLARQGPGDAVEQMLALRFAEDALAAFQRAAQNEPEQLPARRNVERALLWIASLQERRSARPKTPRFRPGTPLPVADPGAPPLPPPAQPLPAPDPAGTAPKPEAVLDLLPAEVLALRARLEAKEREKRELREQLRARSSGTVEKDW